MADYSQVNDYSAKDALSTGNPLKLIKGSDIDQEFSAIQTAIATKFDSTDIATAGEAQAGVSNTVVITPARLTAWAQNDAGVIEDLQALADPNADRLIFWDDSAGAAAFLTVGTGLTISGTTITSTGVSGVSIVAGNGLSGGGELTTSRTVDLDYNELTAATPVAADLISFADISDSNTVKKATITTLNSLLTLAGLGDYDANDNIDHSTITLTAGEGLTGGGTIDASRSFALDVGGLTEETTLDVANDVIVFYDSSAAAHRKVPIDSLVGSTLGEGKWYRSSTQALTAGVAATVVFNAAEVSSLTRGSFSTTTGQYTATAVTRIWIESSITIAAINDDQPITIEIQVDGTTKLRTRFYNDTDNDTPEQTVRCGGLLDLPNGTEVVRVRVTTGSSETISAGTAYSNVSIMELA